MPRPEKTQAVQEIAGRFTAAEAALLTEYRGLHVGEIAQVRSALREADADYKVLKNTLARIAVREVGLDELVGMLEGPTAIAFCHGDAVAAAKALDEAARRFPVLVIKGGVLQGRVIGSDQAQSLARLESREIQLGKIVMLVNTPLQQMANVLAAPLRDLGSMLSQLVERKGTEQPPASASVEPSGEAEAAAGTEEPGAAAPPEAGGDAPETKQPEAATTEAAETPPTAGAAESEVPQAAEPAPVETAGAQAEAQPRDEQDLAGSEEE